MKKLLIIFTLLFSVMFSTTSFSEWMKLGENIDTDYYIDVDSMIKKQGYIYYWFLMDLKKSVEEIRSIKVFIQGDCNLLRLKTVSYHYYSKPIGKEFIRSEDSINKNWQYVPPDETFYELRYICKNYY